jgi:hypothetical protein
MEHSQWIRHTNESNSVKPASVNIRLLLKNVNTDFTTLLLGKENLLPNEQEAR